MEEVKFEGKSFDIVKENKEALKQIFPQVVTDGKIDFETLREILGDDVEESKERYGFNWFGKSKAIKLAQQESTGTLRPCKEESKNWNTTKNLYIEGDNLEVLKILQNSYRNKIKMIYIDPPYNTGNDFVYKDDYNDNLANYLKQTNQVDGEGKTSTNTETSGRYHTNWLNMIYPRLMIARNLLTDDGAIFISIGDDEIANLKKVCDEIFGEENFVADAIRIAKRTSDKGTHFRPTKDHVLTYAKKIYNLHEFGVKKDIDIKDYKEMDETGRRYKKSGASLYQPSLDPLRGCKNQRYWISCPDGSFVIPPGDNYPSIIKDGENEPPKSRNDKVWRWSYNSYLAQKDKLIFTKGSSTNPLLDENGNQSKRNIYPKVYFDEDNNATLHPEDVIYDFPNSKGTKELKKINIPFSFAKPTKLIKYLFSFFDSSESVTLDFFSGSATTAHATMELNSEDNGNRKFIMVQLPEATDEKSEAFKAGSKTITEIGKERIRRAGDKIKSESNNRNLDIGFKVFKLDSSNLLKWNDNPDDINVTLESFGDDTTVHGRNDYDLIYGYLLEEGFDLNSSIEKLSLADHTLYSVNDGKIFFCFDKNVSNDISQELIDLKNKYNTRPMVVFKDNGLIDVDKTNLKENLSSNGFTKFVTI